jgi:uncharacterized protein (DUF3820 family)
MGDHADQRRPIRVDSGGTVPVGPGKPQTTFDPTRLDFGHYAGRSIEELAESDPDYLRWLTRHPAGVRYRGEIARVLGGLPVRDYR